MSATEPLNQAFLFILGELRRGEQWPDHILSNRLGDIDLETSAPLTSRPTADILRDRPRGDL